MLDFIFNLDGAVIFVILFVASAYLFDKKSPIACNVIKSLTGQADDFSDVKQRKGKDQEIAELKERIQVLERIVTDPQEQLKRKIDAL